MNNRFIILIGSRNNTMWVEGNITSVINQDYKNYKVIYFDDASDDDTYVKSKLIVKDDNRFLMLTSEHRQYKTWFFSHVEHNSGIDIQDNDIIVFLDGDDTLANDNVLSYLNEVYNQTQCWMTYGGMMVWDGNNLSEPYPQNSEIPQSIKNTKSYRKDTWRTSHLKSMRGFLWKSFNKKDLCPNGIYMVGPDDLAIMFAMLELCPPEKVHRVTDPIYIYNHSNENNNSRAFSDNKKSGIDYESTIRNREPYDTISFVTPTLAGGLGNQMFEIAAAASLAKDNNAILLLNPNNHICPNQGNNISNYLNNIFSKIAIDTNLNINFTYSHPLCTYKPIPYTPNIKTNGHFQSWKYFHHNREYIQELFAPTKEIKEELDTKYNWIKNYTVIQVRRGDYAKFPEHHPLLPTEYYLNAVKKLNPEKIIIFSDDIEWCKKNLDFNIKCLYNENMSDIMELYLMTRCKDLIISNSSFGWWGAYLNTNEYKKVYVPNYWFGSYFINEGFNINDLVLSEWIKI